ncbi:MAG: outer membrane beta-barrel protein [Chitinophagales bacterium]|nr:outer membrane beta-barrel protein [Chitinophagales bacterium]
MSKTKLTLLALLLFIGGKIQGQYTYQTYVYDNLTSKPIQGATCILIKKSNRKMIGYARSNGLGELKIEADTMKDTLVVRIFHKKYVDYSTEIVYNKLARYRDTAALIPLSKVLQTVIVTANKAITMNGDTVTYVADSFKLPAGSSTEDLLKRLPGIQVSKDGTIKAQGKKVERVLVDGDDFFGEDASVATKNIEASMIDKVEVIDVATRKSDATGSDDEKMKVINLKLKDDAKKGYFGKLEQGYSNTNRYNSTAMANVFRENTKLAGFFSADNMRARMNWQDMRDMGIDNQSWVYDEDLDAWIDKGGDGGTGNTLQVIPQNIKTGGNLNQKFSDGSGVLKARFNHNQSSFDGDQLNNSTTFFNEATQDVENKNYINAKNIKNSGLISIDKTIDSLQKIHIGFTANVSQYDGFNQTDNTIFYDSVLVNKSLRRNPFNNRTESYEINAEYERKFTKKGRLLGLQIDYSTRETSGDRKSIMNGWLYKSNGDSIAQSQDQNTQLFNKNNNLKLSASYIEPLFIKGFYAEFGLNYVLGRNTSFFNTFNKNMLTNEYSQPILSLSNNYYYNVNAWSEQLKLNYKSKKVDWFVGAKLHQVSMTQEHLDSGEVNLARNFNYILPTANISWKYKRNSSLTLNFRKGVVAPRINQLQPFTDNSNPQYITTGNPNLSPTENYSFSLRNNFWYPVSQTNLWANVSFKHIVNDIVDSTIISENGAVQNFFTHVNGNNTANLSIWYGFFFKPLKMQIDPGFWMSFNNRSNYFNSRLIRTNNINSGFYLEMSKSIDSLLQSSLTLNLDWNQARSDNPNFQNTNNFTYQISTKQELTLPLQFKLIGEFEYQILPSNAAFADNQTYILLNGSLEKSFLKENALTLRFSAYDILGQNRSIWRSLYQNTRSETINQALTRYFMLTMVYKFKNKRKQGSNESDF